jgi:putative transposase
MSIPKAVRLVWRKGVSALETVQPSIQRDYTIYKPMEIIVGDYMTQDFMLRYKNKVCRAKVVAFMDMRTRAIVGWSLQLTANSTGVAIALQQCFNSFGLPEYIYFDNGKEFKNHFLCGNAWKTQSSVIDAEDIGRDIGVVVEAGVKLVFAHPYNAKAKTIERFWRTLHDAFDRWEPSYLGSNTLLSTDESKVYRQNIKKMKQEDFDRIPEFKEVETMLNHFFAYYNHKHQHTGQGMEGKTPMQVWGAYDLPKREVPTELKPYLFTHRYKRTVGKNGISYDGGLYYADKLIQYLGQQVQIRVPLDRDDLLYVFPEQGEPFEVLYRDDGKTTEEKIEKVGKLRKQNAAYIKKYNRNKDNLDKHEFVTVAEAWAREHPELVAQEPELQVVNGEPIINEDKPELKLVKSKLIKLFK